MTPKQRVGKEPIWGDCKCFCHNEEHCKTPDCSCSMCYKNHLKDKEDKSQGDKPEVMLKAVIEKAQKNGWGTAWEREFWKHWELDGDNSSYFVSRHPGLQSFRQETLLFSHRFAKAYWGEKWICRICGNNKREQMEFEGCECGGEDICNHPDFPIICLECHHEDEGDIKDLFLQSFEYHLQQAVIAPDALIYYFEHL